MTKIAVFGAGTWGIALARLLAANGRDVTVWSAIPAELKSLSTTHRHPNLPGMELPAAMHYTADIAEACTGRDILLFAVPSPFVRATAKKAAPHIPEGQLIVDVAKGVEDKTLMTMSEIIEDELAKAGRKARVVALSGPTHAEEVARDMPTAIVAASADEDAAKTVQKVFTTPTFRVYTNDDRRGTELGGAVKNVIALAVGIALGLGYGDNAKAALITRGNAELSRLGIAMGCKAETFAGLSGMGDLIVTCTSMHSRNLHAGMLIGRGKSVEEAKAQNLPKVQFVGQLPRDALHRLMAESRAVIAASLCYESFALVPAEAHALGTPVLASGIGNVGASVRPGFDGLCFAPGDPAALAGAVRAMSAMQFDCTAISNATRRRFSAEENYKTLLKLYGRRAAEEVS